MKHIIYTAFILLLASACSKPAPAPGTEQYGRYIFFSQQVGTKAALIESDEAMNRFGVVGFKYEGNWADNKASLTPNVFYDENSAIVTTETLECAGEGIASYAPLQGWSNSKKYAFFAYYPMDHQAVTLVNLNGTPYTAGVPAIKYTMNQSDLKASMVDVMTAPALPLAPPPAPQYTDLFWKSATDNNTNGEITFSFDHRLSSLGLKVKNSSDGSIMINSVEFIVSGIGYSAIVIPLDGSSVQKTAASLSATLPLTLGEGEEGLTPSQEIEIADKLIFIPQTTALSVRVRIGYTRVAPTGSDYKGYTDTITLPGSGSPLTTTLTEGTRHLVHLNFTDSEVEIKPGFAEYDWVDIPDVEDTFN